MKKLKYFLYSIPLIYVSNIIIWVLYTKNKLVNVVNTARNEEVIRVVSETISEVDSEMFNGLKGVAYIISFGFGGGWSGHRIPILIILGIYIYFLNYKKLILEWVDENILNKLSDNNSQTTTEINGTISTSERNEAIGYLKRGNQEFKNNQFVNAIKYYTKAIEIDSSFKEAYNNRDKAKKKL